MGRKMRRWVVVFEVDEGWVEDGFDLTDDRALSWLERDLSHSIPGEVSARVVVALDIDRGGAADHACPRGGAR